MEETTTTGLAKISQNEALYLLRTIWPKAPDAEVIKAGILCPCSLQHRHRGNDVGIYRGDFLFLTFPFSFKRQGGIGGG